MQTLYRIVEVAEQCILAEGMTSELQAREQLNLIQLDYPNTQLEIETYTRIDPAVASKT
jgi:hypothetical protein